MKDNNESNDLTLIPLEENKDEIKNYEKNIE